MKKETKSKKTDLKVKAKGPTEEETKIAAGFPPDNKNDN